jgi:hypothetical protein
MNKAETTLRITVSQINPEVSIVDCVFSEIYICPFAFRIGQYGTS